MEQQFGLKALVMNYVVFSERPAADLVAETHSIVDQRGKELQDLRLSRMDGRQQLAFSLEATREEHKQLMNALHQSDTLKDFEVKAGPEAD
jgi:hypothetical protein